MGAGVAGGLATAPTESRGLLRVVHVLQREGKEHGWGTLGPDLTPAGIFYVHIEKRTEAVTKPQHRALQEHPPQRERTPSTQGEGWGGGAPTCYLHPSFEHHPALLSAGWEAGKNTPKN